MNYTCHSGGALGADIAWETIGKEFGVQTIAYSFPGHSQHGEKRQVLSAEELEEGFQHILEANKTVKRYPQRLSTYVKNLLARNWFQVKNSDTIFAVGKFIDRKLVSGGTGWAVQMAIDNKKKTFFFDQPSKTWNIFNYDTDEFDTIDYVPKLTENFAGIGTRDLNDDGFNAIVKVFENTIGVVA